ncbi:MAG: cysteine hydrolase family protein [Sporolactobacillus sp.]
MHDALVVIDLQNDYFGGGAFPLEKANEALAHCLELISYFIHRERPVYLIQHISHGENADFFREGTLGADLHTEINAFRKNAGVTVIQKAFPNSFLQTELQEALRHAAIDRLAICGMMTHMCVDSTTRQAREFGYAVDLLADACATRSLSFHDRVVPAADVQYAFLAALANFATVRQTAGFLAQQK